MRALLPFFALLASCELFVAGLGPARCQEGAAPRCDQDTNTLVTCDGGLETQRPCGDATCNDAAAACVPATCGDGIIDADEQCDDANNATSDTGEADCTNPFCGNGIPDPGEQCDDGNNVDGDGCDSQCLTETCGDGVAEVGEFCPPAAQ